MKNFVLKLSCLDQRGIVGAVGQCIADMGGCINESGQFVDPLTQRLFMQVRLHLGDDASLEVFDRGVTTIAERYGMRWETFDLAVKPRVLIMVSQLGHCLNDLLYRNSIGQLPMELVGLVSNHRAYQARVEHEGIAFHYLPVTRENKAHRKTRYCDCWTSRRSTRWYWRATCRSCLTNFPASSRARSSTSTIPSCPASRARSPTTKPMSVA